MTAQGEMMVNPNKAEFEIHLSTRPPRQNLDYSAERTKSTSLQPTFWTDLDVPIEVLEGNSLKYVISPILVIFRLLEQILLAKKKKTPSDSCFLLSRHLQTLTTLK